MRHPRYIGLDLALATFHKAVVIDEQGRDVTPASSVETSAHSLEQLFHRAREGSRSGEPLVVVMEPTRMVTEQTTLAWFPVAVFCQRLGRRSRSPCRASTGFVRVETAFLDYAYLQVEVTREQALLSMLEAEYKQLQLETVCPLYRQLHPSRNLETLYGVGQDGAAHQVFSFPFASFPEQSHRRTLESSMTRNGNWIKLKRN